MIGVVDVGGGLRGIYGAGILDFCLQNNIHFDYCIGVSAGSANIVSYAAHQQKRNYYYFWDYSFRKEYMSLSNLIRKHSYLDMDYIYSTLYNHDGERPLDYEAVVKSGIPLRIVATDALTGHPHYFTEKDLSQDHYDVIKASCSIPVVNQPYVINNIPYYDGGISDPVPFQKAFADGCDRLVVILTKPLDFYADDHMERRISRIIQKKYPKSAELLSHRNQLYLDELAQLKPYADEGKVLIIAPKTIYNMGTLTKDRGILQKLYDDAFKQAEAIPGFLDS